MSCVYFLGRSLSNTLNNQKWKLKRSAQKFADSYKQLSIKGHIYTYLYALSKPLKTLLIDIVKTKYLNKI